MGWLHLTSKACRADLCVLQVAFYFSSPFSCSASLTSPPPLQREEERRSAKAESQQVHLADIQSYVTHIKLTHSIRRTLLLVRSMQQGQKKGRPEEFVRLYDSLLQVQCVEGRRGVGECGCIMCYTHSMYVKDICGTVFLSPSQHKAPTGHT